MLVLIRHGSIASVTTISVMQVVYVQNQVKETNHHEHDSPPICIHLGLCETTAIERIIFCESRHVRKCNCTSACLTTVGDDNSLR